MELPNTPNFNPTWKRQNTDKTRRRNAYFYKKGYFKKLSKIMELPEEAKDEENLLKMLNRGSTILGANGQPSKDLFHDAIDGIKIS